MSSPSGTATIGLQIVLADAASAGLTALGLGFLGLSGKLIQLNNSLSQGATLMNVLGATAIASGALFGIFAGAIGYSIEQGQELQDALVQVQNSVQGTDGNMQAMTQTIITLGNTSIFSSQELADGFAAMGKNGQTATDIIKYTGQQMVILAEALNTDTVPAANLLTSVMQQYGAPASQAAEYTKALTFAFYNGQGSVTGLQAAFNQTIPLAQQLGININQLAIFLDVLGQDGYKGEQAGVALRYMMAGLITPTQQAIVQMAGIGLVIVNQTTPALDLMIKKLEESGGVAGKEAAGYNGTIANLQAIYTWAQKLGDVPLNETFFQWALSTGQITDKLFNAQGKFIGLSNAVNMIGTAIQGLPEAQKLAVLQQIFSISGGQGIDLLATNLPKTDAQVKQLTKDLANTNPIADAQRVVGTLSGQMKALGTSIQDAAAVIGLQIIPVITQFVGHVNNLVGVFAKASPQVHQFAAVFLLAGAAITGLALVASIVAIAVTTVGVALLWIGGSALGLMAAIGLVTAGFILIQTHGKQIQQALAPLGGLFQAFGAQLNNIGTVAKSSFGPAFQQIGQIIRSQLIPAFIQMEPALKIIGIVLGVTLVAAIALFIAVVTGIISALARVLVGAVMFGTGLVQIISGALQIVMSLVGGVLALLGDLFHGNWAKMGTDAQNILGGMAKGIGTIFSGLQNMLQGLITATIGMALSLFGGFANSLLALLGSLPGRVGGAIVGLIDAILDPVKTLPASLSSLGSSMIQGLINGIEAQMGRLTGVMKNLAGGMISQLQGILGIHSPSTVMMEIGGNTATGFLQGITGTNVAGPGSAHLAGVVAATRSAVSGGISAAARGAAGASGQNVQTTIQVTLDSKTMATAVLQNLTGQLQMNGAIRKTR